MAQKYPLLSVLGWTPQSPARSQGPLITVHDTSISTQSDLIVAPFISHSLDTGSRVIVIGASNPASHWPPICRRLGGVSLDAAASAGRYTFLDVNALKYAAEERAGSGACDATVSACVLGQLLAYITAPPVSLSSATAPAPAIPTGAESSTPAIIAAAVGAPVCVAIDNLSAISALLCSGDDTYCLDWLSSVVSSASTTDGCVLAVVPPPAAPAPGPSPLASAASIPPPAWNLSAALAAAADPVAALTADWPPALAGGLAGRAVLRAGRVLELRQLPTGHSQEVAAQLTIVTPHGVSKGPGAGGAGAVSGAARVVFVAVESSGALVCHTPG